MGRRKNTGSTSPQSPRKRSKARAAAVLVRMSAEQRERLTSEAHLRGLSMNEVVLEELAPLLEKGRRL